MGAWAEGRTPEISGYVYLGTLLTLDIVTRGVQHQRRHRRFVEVVLLQLRRGGLEDVVVFEALDLVDD